MEFNRLPAVYTSLPLLAGIAAGKFLDAGLSSLAWFYFSASLTAIFLLAVYVYLKLKKTVTGTRLLAYLVLLAAFGFVSIQYRYHRVSGTSIIRFLDKYEGRNVTLYGTIIEQPEVRDDRVRLVVSADSIGSSGNVYTAEGNVLASVYKNRYSESIPVTLKYGDEVVIGGRLEKLPRRRNPGEFDYGEYLRIHGIDAQFTAFGYDKVEYTGSHNVNFLKNHIIFPLKEYSVGVIDSLVGGNEGEYLKGLVLGERSNISKEIKENFINAGVAHIIAVSGLNVAYVVIIVNGILLLVPLKRSIKTFIIILALLFYMNLTGNVPSIVRATVMAVVFLSSQLLERKGNPYNIIAFSAIVILAGQPEQLFDAGFILSYSAILSIVYFYPRLNALVPGNAIFFKVKAVRLTVDLLIGTLAAQAGTLPVTAVMFKKISVVSLFVNIIAIPAANIALAQGFAVVIVSAFSGWLAGTMALSAKLLLFFQLAFIDYFANVSFSYVETYGLDAMFLVFYYAAFFYFFSPINKGRKLRMLLSALLLSCFFFLEWAEGLSDKLRVTYLDVGNSSCTLFQFPGGTNILINTGSSTQNYSSAERNVIPYLKKEGVTMIDVLILTNINKDEFRNLAAFTELFKVSRIVVPEAYRPLFSEFNQIFNSIRIEFIEKPEVMNRDGNFRVYLMYDSENLSGRSMMVNIIYGSTQFTFSDSYTDEEDHFYSNMNLFDSTSVLRVPASGSFDYTSPEFIIRAAPEHVVISSRNPGKKLNSEVFESTLQLSGIKVLNTKESGAVIFETDGREMRLVEWK